MAEIGKGANLEAVFAGEGEMARRMREFDWSQTPLGPPEGWSTSLRMMVKFLLANRFPLLLWWGPDQCQLYNDPYRPVLGTKHPRSIGQPARECWSEIWHVIGPLILTPYNSGPATWDDDIFLEINRHGFVEETHFTIAYSPVPDESAPGGVGGVLATVHEITQQVLQERRLAALRDLGAGSSEAKTAEEAGRIAAEAFGRHPKDVPFALIYLLDADQRTARLAGAAGVGPGRPASPTVVDLGDEGAAWPLASVLADENPRLVENLAARFAGAVPAGPWSDRPNQALVLPIPSNVQHRRAGFLVLGISARLAPDDLYRGFCELATTQVATAIANARAYEEERQRAEALAELDRAKTTFFSNVSHEFRTPLTLSLGPVDDALADADHPLPEKQRERLEIVQRNHLRLLKLVNTLLDFSRIEAGRIQAAYEPTDLSGYTAELASTFRSAIERAGLRLVVDCPSLSQPVYVDRDMWEKIVLNLLSNAFKFTFEGEIGVSLRERGGMVELEVRDTGVGIPPEGLARVFERFHRIEGTRARTHEGSGIGLALVQELARLHGGTVEVASIPDQGSAFTVRIPLGSAHLPADRVQASRSLPSTALGAAPYVEEALRWGSGGGAGGDSAESPSPRGGGVRGGVAFVLVADDNADMREYVRHLLAPSVAVETVADGEAALAVARERRPDLVLADVMMPNLDGFGLLRALRADPGLRTIPLILLSARAGEEARVEGLQAGADDYLVKPFNARELRARIGARIELTRARQEAEQALRGAVAREEAARAEAEAAVRARDEFLSIAAHELKTPITGLRGTAQLELRRIELSGQLDPEQVLRAFRRFDRQGAKLVALINQLLDVSRIEMGQLALNPAPTDLSALLEEIVEETRGRSERHPVTFRTPGPLVASVDALRLEQVFHNLLDNAIKYSPEGGEIGVELARPADGTAEIRVRDHGIGIAPEHRGRIFERFYQAHRDPGLAGLGLGLYVSRQVVALHQGRIRAEFPSDGGSCFVVELPVTSDE